MTFSDPHPITRFLYRVTSSLGVTPFLRGSPVNPVNGRPFTPSLGFPSPSALAAPGVRFTQGTQPWHVPTSGFCTLLPVYSSQRLPSLFHLGSTLGVPPFRGSPHKEPCRLFRLALTALLAFSPICIGSHGVANRGRSRPARLEFAAEPFSPSGLWAPHESARFRIRVYACETPCPSWASTSLRLSPRLGVERISPLFLSRAFYEIDFRKFPFESRLRRRPRVFPLRDMVASPFSRPPGRLEVFRFRRSGFLGTFVTLAYVFASSGR